jgi:hypothetical protein
MAWSVSGLFVPTWLDLLDTTQLAIDLDLETHKIALYNNTETPNYSSQTAYSATNEVTGTNWPAGGVALTGTTITESPTGSLMFDATDISVASATFTNAYGAKIYADALAGDNLIAGVYFGGSAYSPNNGTFQITWAAAGIFAIDITP